MEEGEENQAESPHGREATAPDLLSSHTARDRRRHCPHSTAMHGCAQFSSAPPRTAFISRAGSSLRRRARSGSLSAPATALLKVSDGKSGVKWTQTDEEVTLSVPLDEGITRKGPACRIAAMFIRHTVGIFILNRSVHPSLTSTCVRSCSSCTGCILPNCQVHARRCSSSEGISVSALVHSAHSAFAR